MARARKRGMPPALARYWKKRRAKRRNPKPKAVVLYARRPGGTLLKWTGRKFATSGRAVQFANRASAAAVAGMLRLQFPVLKRYRLIIA
jgi:hypothetical protein